MAQPAGLAPRRGVLLIHEQLKWAEVHLNAVGQSVREPLKWN